jgi:hypothetical protein
MKRILMLITWKTEKGGFKKRDFHGKMLNRVQIKGMKSVRVWPED